MLKILVFLMALCALSMSSFADEVWVCRFPESSNRPSEERYWLHGGHFIEIEEPYVVYDFVVVTDLAIIAMSGTALDADVAAPTQNNPSPEIESETLVINRKTGEAIEGYVSLYDSNPKNPFLRGRCWQQKTDDKDAVWPPGFKKD